MPHQQSSTKVKGNPTVAQPAEALTHESGNAPTPAYSRAGIWELKTVFILFICLLSIYSPALMLYKIHANGVNVPFWDEWDYVNMFRAFSEGDITLGQLLLSNVGEHKVVGQVVFSIVGWQLTGMQIPILLTFNWLLGISFCVLAALITRRAFPQGIQPLVTFAAASFLLFNPVAYQPWLWSIAPVYLLIPLMFFIGVVTIQSSIPLSARIAICGILAFAGSFTLGSGLLLWVLFPAVLLFHTTKTAVLSSRWGSAVFLVLALLTGSIFFSATQHFHTAVPKASAGIKDLASFFLAYTGNLVALSSETVPMFHAQFMGLVLILFFTAVSSLAVLVYRNRPEFRVVFVWILLGLYGIIAGMLIAWARIGFGVRYPLEASRYVVASSFLPLACMVLATTLLAYYFSRVTLHVAPFSWLVAFTAIIVAAIVWVRFLQTPRAFDMMTHSYFHQLRGKVAVSSVNYAAFPTYQGIFPRDNFQEFARSVRFLNARGWLHPTIWDDAFLKRVASKPPDVSYGYVDRADMANGKATVTGWAYLTNRQERPHAIIALAIKTGVAPRFVGLAVPSGLRHDVYKKYGNGEALSTGWSIEIPEAELKDPLEKVIFSVYDAANGDAFRFPGELSGSHLRQ